jgi:hypothetical protein
MLAQRHYRMNRREIKKTTEGIENTESLKFFQISGPPWLNSQTDTAVNLFQQITHHFIDEFAVGLAFSCGMSLPIIAPACGPLTPSSAITSLRLRFIAVNCLANVTSTAN